MRPIQLAYALSEIFEIFLPRHGQQFQQQFRAIYTLSSQESLGTVFCGPSYKGGTKPSEVPKHESINRR